MVKHSHSQEATMKILRKHILLIVKCDKTKHLNRSIFPNQKPVKNDLGTNCKEKMCQIKILN
jgi:hypothetical protein